MLGCPLTRPLEYLSRVGALIEGPAFYPVLSGRDNLRVLARLGGTAEARVGEVLDRVGLASRADDRFRSYSLGMKQLLSAVAAGGTSSVGYGRALLAAVLYAAAALGGAAVVFRRRDVTS